MVPSPQSPPTPMPYLAATVGMALAISQQAFAFAPSIISHKQTSCHRTTSSLRHLPRDLPLVLLHAKKKSKSSSIRDGGSARKGFGASASSSSSSSTKKQAASDDFKAFPRLEPQVMETLVEAPDILYHEPGVLPDQVYEHLGKVYGFENFNGRLQVDAMIVKSDAESSPMSFEDLLTAAPSDESTGSTSTVTSRSLATDFNDLISLATGGQPTSAREVEGAKQNLSQYLNQLPPFTEFRVLHFDPLVLAIDDFFSAEECDRYIAMSSGGSSESILKSRSPTVGKDKKSISQRTSTTWYHFYKGAPELMAKATKLVGIDSIAQWEEPQTVRYRRTEKFTWHLDALGPDEGRSTTGGQRIATLLVYLSDLSAEEGGATMFRDLKTPEGERLTVSPKKGSALLFFPAAGGIPDTPFDIRTLHCGEVVSQEAEQDKWIAQLWLCAKDYVPTAPTRKNLHSDAFDEIAKYCEKMSA